MIGAGVLARERVFRGFCSLWLLGLGLVPPARGQVGIRELDRVSLQDFQGCSIPLRSPAGELWCIQPGGRIISHYARNGSLLKRIQVDGMPELRTSKVTVLQDMAVDSANNVYVAGLWRSEPRSFASGLFVFDAEGRYLRTVTLTPSVELRHAAVDAGGNIYALGVDGDFVRRRTDYCLLIHKYSPEGKRLTAFSSCPTGLILRTPVGTAGSDFKKLSADTDNGRIWVTGDKIYHLMPTTHILRVFDVGGKQLQETIFSAPVSPGTQSSPSPLATATDSLVRVLPLSANRYAIEWQHAEYLESTRNSSRFWAMHGASGLTIGKSVAPPLFTMLLTSDESGDCYALTASSSPGGKPTGIDLIRIRPE